MSTKNLLKEYRKISGLICEADDYQLVQNIVPGIKNATEQCKEACDEMQAVVERLEKLSQVLRGDSNSLHLPAESEFLKGRLRNALRSVLSSEPAIRKALSALEQLS